MSEQPEAADPAAGAPVGARRKRRRPSLRLKLLFAGLVLVVPALGLEGALRLCGWPTNRIRSVGKLTNVDPESFAGAIGVFQPGAQSRVSWPPSLAYTVKINRLGLRGPETTLRPAPGTFRILALGDSTTFGYYVEEDQTLPQALQRRLRAAGASQVEVLNGGCGGWTISSESEWLIERGLQLEPQLVVLTFCSNDLTDLRRKQSNFQTQKDNLGAEGIALKSALYASAIYELALRVRIAWKQARLEAAGEQPHALSSVDVQGPERAELWGRYRVHLTTLRDALRAREVPLVVCYLPDAWRLQEGLPEEDDPELGALCAELEIPYASASERFRREPVTSLFHAPQDAHQNAAGNEALAEVTSALLRERGLVPGAAK